jgi:flagellar hook protein FlgE
MVITSVTGDVELVDRRISGISFESNGAFGEVADVTGSAFTLRFLNDTTGLNRVVDINLGSQGEFNGLTQFGGTSTVAPGSQDGYSSGWLSGLSVSRDGVMVGMFTNGVRREVAAMKIATFQNPAGLESVGNNYYVSSSNSGDPVVSKALAGGAGSVRGGALEKSNVEVSAEFVNLIQAQNGFQANARTIRVANDMLRDLTDLIR